MTTTSTPQGDNTTPHSPLRKKELRKIFPSSFPWKFGIFTFEASSQTTIHLNFALWQKGYSLLTLGYPVLLTPRSRTSTNLRCSARRSVAKLYPSFEISLRKSTHNWNFMFQLVRQLFLSRISSPQTTSWNWVVCICLESLVRDRLLVWATFVYLPSFDIILLEVLLPLFFLWSTVLIFSFCLRCSKWHDGQVDWRPDYSVEQNVSSWHRAREDLENVKEDASGKQGQHHRLQACVSSSKLVPPFLFSLLKFSLPQLFFSQSCT